MQNTNFEAIFIKKVAKVRLFTLLFVYLQQKIND